MNINPFINLELYNQSVGLNNTFQIFSKFKLNICVLNKYYNIMKFYIYIYYIYIYIYIYMIYVLLI